MAEMFRGCAIGIETVETIQMCIVDMYFFLIVCKCSRHVWEACYMYIMGGMSHVYHGRHLTCISWEASDMYIMGGLLHVYHGRHVIYHGRHVIYHGWHVTCISWEACYMYIMGGMSHVYHGRHVTCISW